MSPKGLFVFTCALLLSLGVLRVPASSRQAGSARSSPPADAFATSVKPFLQTYCYGCHSGNQPAAGFDLTSYPTQDSVLGDQRHWNLVLTRLKAGEMPPTQSRQQPTAAQRQAVVDWIEAIGAEDAKRHPNDPGVVLARRLSNAEYDYTIRDLTGVDIRPTREFPVDPANEAGFDNSARIAGDVAGPGEEVPGGGARCRRPPRPEAGRLRLRAAPGRRRHRPRQVLRPPHHRLLQAAADRLRRLLPRRLAVSATARRCGEPTATLADVAAEARLSPKYLATIWATLTAPAGDVGPDRRAPGAVARAAAPDGREPRRTPRGPAASGCATSSSSSAPQLAPEVKNLTAARDRTTARSRFVLWKNRQFAANRMRYAGRRAEIELPTCRRTRRPARALAVPDDPDGVERYEATFDRFCATFPDAFFVSERGRVYLDHEKEKQNAGPAAERRLPQHDGLLPRRRPALRADPRRRRAARARRPLAGVRLHHRRPDAAVHELHLVRAGRAAQLHARPRVRLRPRRGQGRRPPRRRSSSWPRSTWPRRAEIGASDDGDRGDRGLLPDHRREHPPGRAGDGRRPSRATSRRCRRSPSGPTAGR